ncbi:hypothetical protein AB0I90_19025 [Micromonospora wenchangensis]|uniref:hypothetical protein n=1 Tax=Micromonospora wenchangensis TaxID=1185415 RepID=UPI0033FA4A1B
MAVRPATSGERSKARLPVLAGLGVWLTTGLAFMINLVTDLVPSAWEKWPPYPWVATGGTLALSITAAWITAKVQRTGSDASDAGPQSLQSNSQQAGGVSVQNASMVYFSESSKTAQADPMIRVHRWDGSKSESVEIFDEQLAISYMKLRFDKSDWADNTNEDDK